MIAETLKRMDKEWAWQNYRPPSSKFKQIPARVPKPWSQLPPRVEPSYFAYSYVGGIPIAILVLAYWFELPVQETRTMSTSSTSLGSSVIAVYPDHASAERAVRKLHEGGFAMSDLSIVGRDFQVSEEPIGFVTAGDFATAGAGTGAWVGGLFGLLIGAAFLILPGVGPVIVAGPLSAALLGGIEGAIAGAALGALGGALVGWGVPREQAIKYETQVKAGKFLVLARGGTQEIERAKSLLGQELPEQMEVYGNASV